MFHDKAEEGDFYIEFFNIVCDAMRSTPSSISYRLRCAVSWTTPSLKMNTETSSQSTLRDTKVWFGWQLRIHAIAGWLSIYVGNLIRNYKGKVGRKRRKIKSKLQIARMHYPTDDTQYLIPSNHWSGYVCTLEQDNEWLKLKGMK